MLRNNQKSMAVSQDLLKDLFPKIQKLALEMKDEIEKSHSNKK